MTCKANEQRVPGYGFNSESQDAALQGFITQAKAVRKAKDIKKSFEREHGLLSNLGTR
jgi:hypothetical protein